MSDLTDVRAAFPFLSECVYLDTAGAGLACPGQGAAVAHFYDHVKARGMLGRDEWRGKLASLQRRLGLLLGVDPGRILLFGNTSEGINLVAHSLSWNAGDNIVVAHDEYPTMLNAWHVAGRAGVDVIQVPITDERERTSRLLGAMNQRTRVLAASQVHWGTGTVVDLQRAGAACRANGTLFVVDGIQALGAIPVDLSVVDVYSAAAFKWLLSGFGMALCVVGERAEAQLDSSFRGAMNLPAPHSLQYSHVNYPGIYALDAALSFLEDHGWARIHAQVAALSGYLCDQLAANGFSVAAPAGARAGIVAFPVPDPAAVGAALDARSIKVTQRGPGLRVSPHFYNNQKDLDRFIEALCAITHPG